MIAQIAPEEAIDLPSVDWTAMAPLIVLVGGAVLLLVIAGLAGGPRLARWYGPATVVIAAAAGVTAVPLWDRVRDEGAFSTVAGAIGVDGFSVFFTVVMCAAVVLAALLADGYLRREGMEGVELFVLMLLSASGGVIMAAANDLIVTFLGLEILSIAVYVLAAMHLRRLTSQEAGLKYFLLGAFSSAFFLYGIALVYGATGSTNLARIAEFSRSTDIVVSSGAAQTAGEPTGLLLAGLGLLLVGFGFKVAAAPFHAWTPDVYQGSPSPVVAFMASGVKAAGFAGLLRVFMLAFPAYASDWQPYVYALAVLTLVVGSVLAVVQTDVKRLLAYSSISHAGFILLGLQAAGDLGTAASLFYLAAYTFMVAGSFGVVTLVARPGDTNHDLSEYRGLSRRAPLLALTFTLFLLAQAGVPLTAGFFAKLYVLQAAIEAGSWPLALVAMVCAVIAAFLYLRIIVAMYMGEEEGETPAPAGSPVRVPALAGAALAVAATFTLVVGFLPSPVAEVTRDATPELVAPPG
ncbi:MAG: NADH-quinone oxidoreductase subunit N [Acidimicrobiales bacterium]